MPAIYDQIGKTYTSTRAADPRIAERIAALLALPKSRRILDVGAGTGNYSRAIAESGYKVTALEPSQTMRDQGKQHPHLKWIAGSAEELPFPENSFDGVMMTLCIHHFANWFKAFSEAKRVCPDGPIVILSFDTSFESNFWLHDYFPAFKSLDEEWMPRLGEIQSYVEQTLDLSFSFERFSLPHDLVDNFAAANWQRPEFYLDPIAQAGISSFAKSPREEVEAGLASLREDLKTGVWNQKHGYLKNRTSLDVGYVFLKFSA
ncbi:MAG: class I SAM-dependent methyltransferase [Verrucomicrobiota bacterium]